jgi:hypothetical protein
LLAAVPASVIFARFKLGISAAVSCVAAVILPFASTVNFVYVPALTPVLANTTVIVLLALPSNEVDPVASPLNSIFLAVDSLFAFATGVDPSKICDICVLNTVRSKSLGK